MECCHVWGSAPSGYWDILQKLQNQVCRIFGLTLVACLETLAHSRNAALN